MPPRLVASSARRSSHRPDVLTDAGATMRRMAKIGRNELCSCGSGRKVKRCCGVARGPSECSLAEGFLRSAAREAASASTLSDTELSVLLDELVELPCVDLSLQVQL